MKITRIADVVMVTGVGAFIVLAVGVLNIESLESIPHGLEESGALAEQLAPTPPAQSTPPTLPTEAAAAPAGSEAEFEEKMTQWGFTKINGTWAPRKIPLALRLAVRGL